MENLVPVTDLSAEALEGAVIDALACVRHGEVAVVPIRATTCPAPATNAVEALALRMGLVVVDAAGLAHARDVAGTGRFVRGLRGRPVLLVTGVAAPSSDTVPADAVSAAAAREGAVVVLLCPHGARDPAWTPSASRRRGAPSTPYVPVRIPVPRVAEGESGARSASSPVTGDAQAGRWRWNAVGNSSLAAAALARPCAPDAVRRARQLAGAGRRAAGEVALRAAMSRLVHPLDAGDRLACRIELARSHLETGRLAEALRTLGAAVDLLAPGMPAELAWASLVVEALVRLERRDFTRAVEQLSTAFEAGRHAAPEVAVDAGLSLVRCFSWGGHPGASARWAGRVANQPALAPSPVVELAWRRARLARRGGDLGGAAQRLGEVTRQQEMAAGARERAGLLMERAALALVAGEVDGADGQARLACELVARAGALVRARVEADWFDIVVDHAPLERAISAGRVDGRRARGRDAPEARPAGLTPLLEWRRREALARLARRRAPRSLAPMSVRGQEARPRMISELTELIELVQAHETGAVPTAMCEWLRAHLSAVSVAFFDVANPGTPARIAGAGGSRWPACSTIGQAIESRGGAAWVEADGAIEVAMPIAAGNRIEVVLAVRWPAGSPPTRDRAAAMLEAAVAVSRAAVQAHVADRRRVPPPEPDAFGLVGTSAAMAVVREAVRRAGLAPFPVLIEGESGSGKELIARAIHAAGPRRHRRFCAVNCAAMNDDLVEGELFGHARGAFTGAVQERAGLFEEADGGTLFLDEVGELSARAQAKLLRALQEGEVRRIGENLPRRVDTRIVAATNRTLAAEVERGAFRSDLRYRLDVLHMQVPPLRGRRDDIPLLIAHLWRGLAARAATEATLSPELVEALTHHDWPGNVRELQNVLATLAVHAPRRGRLGTSLLPRVLGLAAVVPAPATLDEARRRFEAQFVRDALVRCGGRRTDAARALGLSRQGLAKTLLRLGLAPPEVFTDRG